MNDRALLEVTDLSVGIGGALVVDRITLSVGPGESLGLVGESGSGKTTTLRAVLNLLPPGGRITAGQVRFEGEDLSRAGPARLRAFRGAQAGAIWQDPLASLDPLMRVGDQVAETIRAHAQVTRSVARERALDLMRQVDLSDVTRLARRYPHELSGGQRQRIGIAAAIAPGPRLLLADEPTTALDVTVQDQVLRLLARLRADLGLALLLVTHDLAVVARSCDRVAVMYAGRIVEAGPADRVLTAPRHHYTAGLLRSAPRVDVPGVLPSGIPGAPPPHAAAPGCAFAPRCPKADDLCRAQTPVTVGEAGHEAACHHPLERVTRG